MKKIILNHILILAILNPSLVHGQIADNNTLARVTDFIHTFQTKAEEISATETPTSELPPVPSPDNFSQQLNAWEAAAVQGATGPQNSMGLLELKRATPQDRALEREADKIVSDMFRRFNGDSPLEYHANLLELFGTYISSPMSREPLEMIFSRIDAYKFSPADLNRIESNKTFLGNLGKGTLYASLVAGGYFLIAPAKQKAAVVDFIKSPRLNQLYNVLNEKIAKWRGVSTSRDLVLVQPDTELILLNRFRQMYKREPRPGEDLLPFAERRNVVFNEQLRVANPNPAKKTIGTIAKAATKATAQAATNVSTGIVSAGRWSFNKLRSIVLGDYLKLQPAQQVLMTAKFMGINLAAGSAYAVLARRYYNGNNRQHTVMPSDEMNSFVRPLAILDLTCRAESLQMKMKNLRNASVTDDDVTTQILELKDLINDYRFLLRVASMYTNEVAEALPLPSTITSDKTTGMITFEKTFEGEVHSIAVSCPTRQGRLTKTVTLLEAKPILENIRDAFLADEIVGRLEALDPNQAEGIAQQILNMSAQSQNQIVATLVAQKTADSKKATMVLNALDKLMSTADPNEILDLGAQLSGKTSTNGKK